MTVPLPYNMDGVVINLSAYLQDLPEEAYLSEFVPVVTETGDEEDVVIPGDDMMMGDF